MKIEARQRLTSAGFGYKPIPKASREDEIESLLQRAWGEVSHESERHGEDPGKWNTETAIDYLMMSAENHEDYRRLFPRGKEAELEPFAKKFIEEETKDR